VCAREIWGSNGGFCAFGVYLTTPSVSRMLEWILNYEFEGMCKEPGVALFEVLWGFVGTLWRHAGVTEGRCFVNIVL
jgi:hypothetical protein